MIEPNFLNLGMRKHEGFGTIEAGDEFAAIVKIIRNSFSLSVTEAIVLAVRGNDDRFAAASSRLILPPGNSCISTVREDLCLSSVKESDCDHLAEKYRDWRVRLLNIAPGHRFLRGGTLLNLNELHPEFADMSDEKIMKYLVREASIFKTIRDGHGDLRGWFDGYPYKRGLFTPEYAHEFFTEGAIDDDLKKMWEFNPDLFLYAHLICVDKDLRRNPTLKKRPKIDDRWHYAGTKLLISSLLEVYRTLLASRRDEGRSAPLFAIGDQFNLEAVIDQQTHEVITLQEGHNIAGDRFNSQYFSNCGKRQSSHETVVVDEKGVMRKLLLIVNWEKLRLNLKDLNESEWARSN